MSRKIDAAIGTALSGFARRRRLKSKIVKPPKITEAEHRVDDVRVGDRHEDRDDPEHDQGEQRPEQRRAHEDRSRRVA